MIRFKTVHQLKRRKMTESFSQREWNADIRTLHEGSTEIGNSVCYDNDVEI